MLKPEETNWRWCNSRVIAKDSCHSVDFSYWGSVVSVMPILRDVSMVTTTNSKMALITSPISPIRMQMRKNKCIVLANALNDTSRKGSAKEIKF
jgi:hypothetical protein